MDTILVSRTDRAGDLILTLPVFSALRHAFPKARIVAHVRSYTSSLVKLRDDVDQIILDDRNGERLSLLSLSRKFFMEKIDSAIIVHPSMRAILACWIAGIPIRIGRASNLWQFFLNFRMVQHRSENILHEFQYNLDLLRGLGIHPHVTTPRLILSHSEIEKGRSVLDRAGFLGKKPIIVHPGHGGSSHNLSPRIYAKIAQLLCNEGYCVGVTLGPGEEKIKAFFPAESKESLAFFSDLPDLKSLAGLLFHSLAFIGGSTGPMHISASLEVPSIVFFPPQKSMTPLRWGPIGNYSKIIFPPVSRCVEDCSKCNEFPCMEKISPSEVIDALRDLTQSSKTVKRG